MTPSCSGSACAFLMNCQTHNVLSSHSIWNIHLYTRLFISLIQPKLFQWILFWFVLGNIISFFFFFLGSIISCYLQTTKIWPYLDSKLCTRVSIRYINVHTYTLIGLMKKRSEFYYIVFSFVYTWFVFFFFFACICWKVKYPTLIIWETMGGSDSWRESTWFGRWGKVKWNIFRPDGVSTQQPNDLKKVIFLGYTQV